MRYINSYKLFEKISSREELMSNSIKKDGIIEPALMTSDEYLDFLGANKHHPSDAYQFSLVNDSDEISDEKLKKQFKLINTLKHGSIYIQYYVDNGSDFKNNQYVKLDDDGEIMRDDRGMVVYMSRAEIDRSGITYDRNVIAVHDNQIVGSAQDEWGCVLVYVMNELKGIGIGEKLTELYRSYYPNKSSGGTTTSGFNNLRKYHAKQIKLYSRNGIYSDMVKNGEITYDRVKEIINSVSDINIRKKNNSDNIYSKYYNKTTKPNKVFLFGGNDIMMINDNIIGYYEDYDKNYKTVNDEYEKFIFGHCRLHREDNGICRLYFLDGKSEEYLIDLVEYMLSYINHRYGETSLLYYITQYTSELTKRFILNHYGDTKFDNNKYIITSDNIDPNLLNKLKEGTNWFYNIEDEYDEIKGRISENVYSTFQY